MNLAEARRAFSQSFDPTGAAADQRSSRHRQTLDMLAQYFSEDTPLDQITPARLRDFVGRWFLERAEEAGLDAQLAPQALISALSQFFNWAADHAAYPFAKECRGLFAELAESVPRAIQLAIALAGHRAERGGPFGFPEFLTSFEAGGHSEYDIGPGGEPGALEGYFRILRVEAARVEAEEVITETRVWPILFPEGLAPLLAPDYVLNLEIARAPEGWHIIDCGPVYPPGEGAFGASGEWGVESGE